MELQKQLPEERENGAENVAVKSPTDIPGFDPEQHPMDARGAYVNGKKYFVADNISGAKDIAEVNNHEEFHHFVATRPEIKAGLERMFQQNQNVRKETANWLRNNAGDRLTAINEAIAKISEGRTVIVEWRPCMRPDSWQGLVGFSRHSCSCPPPRARRAVPVTYRAHRQRVCGAARERP